MLGNNAGSLARRKLLDEDSLAMPDSSEEPRASESTAEAAADTSDAEPHVMPEMEGQPMAALRLHQADPLSVARSISSQVFWHGSRLL